MKIDIIELFLRFQWECSCGKLNIEEVQDWPLTTMGVRCWACDKKQDVGAIVDLLRGFI